MGEQKREALLACVQDEDKFCDFINSLKREHSATFGEFKSTNGKKWISFMSEIVQELNHKQYERVWKCLSELAISALQNVSELINNNQQEQGENMEPNEDKAIFTLQGVCILLLSSIKLEEPSITQPMIKTVTMLHGSLFDLHEINAPLAACVCVICQGWCKKGLPSHENLCLGTITYNLKMFLHDNKVNSSVVNKAGKLQDICQMQSCLKLFDFNRKLPPENPESEDVPEEIYRQTITEELRQLLLACFLNFTALKENSGRKFLSSVILLDKDIMKDAHQVVINSIGHSCPITKAEALGNVYYQAWRLADCEMKEAFEEICIQDVMYRAVHAPRGKTNNLFVALQRFLNSIVCHKGSAEVRHMITRLYGPIIWRSLKANNAMVRANASNLLLAAFPLEGDSQGGRVAENEQFMQRQFDAINDMLLDVYPRIRVIGITGLCELFHMYWDAIPAHIIAILTRKLYNDLAFDAATEVRHAVFQGTLMLLDTACAHPLLSKLLPPCVEKCLHDVCEKVRVAVADVLLAVKQTSSIQFWSVCPLPNVLAQLEIDNMQVSKRLVKLIFRSFFPGDQSQQVWVERCANFYKRNVNAARKFYMIAEKDLTVQEAGQFLNLMGIFIYNCLLKTIQQSNISTSDLELSENAGDENDSQSRAPQIEGDVLAGLLDTSCILFKSVMRRLSSNHSEKNRNLTKTLMITFSRTIHVCLKVANDERCYNAILLLSTYLPPASLPVFSKSVLPKLRSLADDVPETHYSMLIECMSAWDWNKQFLQLIQDWLSESTKDFESGEAQKKVKTSEGAETSNLSRRSARLSKSSASITEQNDSSVNGAKKKKPKKTVMFTGIKDERRPAQGIKYLKCFLDIQSRSSFSVLDNPQCLNILMTISSNLEKCQAEMMKRISSKSSGTKLWSNDMLVDALSVRSNLLTTIHMFQKQKLKEQMQNNEEEMGEVTPSVPVEDLNSIIDWFKAVLKKYVDSSKVDPNISILEPQQSSNVLSNLSLYRRLFTSLLKTCLDFLSCGIPLFDQVEDALLQLTDTGVNLIEYIGLITKLIHELHEHKILEAQIVKKNQENTESSENDDKVHEKLICIYDSFISSLLQHARQNSENFTQMFRHEVRPTLRTIMKEQYMVYNISPKQTWYKVLTSKTISAILADLFNEIRSSASFASRDRILDLSTFSACMVSVTCGTSGECRYICEDTIATLSKDETMFPEDQRDLVLQSFAHLLYTLSRDGKNKQAAINCISEMNEHVSGFSRIFSKIQTNECVTIEGQNSTKNEDLESLQQEKEEILILEEPNQPPMFMDDEEFV